MTTLADAQISFTDSADYAMRSTASGRARAAKSHASACRNLLEALESSSQLDGTKVRLNRSLAAATAYLGRSS